MSTKIRLTRGGTKKRPHYRVVVADTRSPRDGRFIERLGTYNPLLSKDDPKRVTLNADRIKYWLSMGAKPTDRVSKFLGMASITDMPKPKNNPIKAKPKAKAQERAAQNEEKKSKNDSNDSKETADNIQKADEISENISENKSDKTEETSDKTDTAPEINSESDITNDEQKKK